MSGELALRLIRSIRTSTESTTIDDALGSSSGSSSNNNKQSTSNNSTVTDEIDIVPYKCLCPYSTTSESRNSNLLKKFSRLVKNIPCDRPCPVNLYRHLRNYHKVDLQHAKDITRTIMLSKTVKSEIADEDEQPPTTTIKNRRKLPVGLV
jgi:hypothetical protein